MADPVNERALIAAWLRDQVLAHEVNRWIADGPIWKTLPWAFLHPFKFGKAFGRLHALTLAASDIERGAHLLTQESDNGHTGK